MKRLEKIQAFANRWLTVLTGDERPSVSTVVASLMQECQQLHFNHPDSSQFIGVTFTNEELKNKVAAIEDLELLGTLIDSQLRDLEIESSDWLRLALNKMEQLAKEAQGLFHGQIQTIKLISNNFGYGVMPKADEEIEQQLTINAHGQISLFAYNGFNKLLRFSKWKISQAAVQQLFQVFTEYFSHALPDIFVTDVGNWDLEIQNTQAETFYFSGSLFPQSVVLDFDLSYYIREILKRADLFIFDGQAVFNPINRITVAYQRQEQLLEAPDYGQMYQEELIIDRESSGIYYAQSLGDYYETTHRYIAKYAISSLLHFFGTQELFQKVLGDPPDVIPDLTVTRQYQIQINFADGSKQQISGDFDQNGLPQDWEEFISEAALLMNDFNLTEIFNPAIYLKKKRTEKDFIFCSVVFKGNEKSYHYLTDDPTLVVGDWVKVPIRNQGEVTVGKIVAIDYFTEADAPFPINKIKKIIGKQIES